MADFVEVLLGYGAGDGDEGSPIDGSFNLVAPGVVYR